jgi:hypothetical protein
MLTSCDPADIRQFAVQIPGGASQAGKLINEVDPIVSRYGFSPDPFNGKNTQGHIAAAWRKKVHTSDEATRLACFMDFDQCTNILTVRVILFPGAKLPTDAIAMFNELKDLTVKKGILISISK